MLRELPQVKESWAKMQLAFAKIVAKLRAFRYTASMGLCVDTLRREGHLQLNVHMFIQSGFSATHPPFRVEDASSLAVFGVAPRASGSSAADIVQLTLWVRPWGLAGAVPTKPVRRQGIIIWPCRRLARCSCIGPTSSRGMACERCVDQPVLAAEYAE